MIATRDTRLIENESDLRSCELVLFGEPLAFGLSCRVKVGEEDVPGIVRLRPRSFVLTAASLVKVHESSPVCIALGEGFVVGFDSESVALHARANLGDLIVSETGLQLLTRTVQPPRNYLVNLKTGVATKQTNESGAVIRSWSISVESRGELVKVFSQPGIEEPPRT